MSILPWRIRRRYETSCSSRVSSSIRLFSPASERLARAGSGSNGLVLSSKAKAEVEILAEGRGFLRLHDLLDDPPELRLEVLRLLVASPLGVDVDDGLVRVGQHLRPAALLEDLDPVHQVDVAVAEPFGEQ